MIFLWNISKLLSSLYETLSFVDDSLENNIFK